MGMAGHESLDSASEVDIALVASGQFRFIDSIEVNHHVLVGRQKRLIDR